MRQGTARQTDLGGFDPVAAAKQPLKLTLDGSIRG